VPFGNVCSAFALRPYANMSTAEELVDQVGFELAVLLCGFENSKEIRALIAKSGSGENFPPKLLSACRSPVSAARLVVPLKGLPDSRTFGWTSTAKGAFMLASSVA
jgi:hypothetical protein